MVFGGGLLDGLFGGSQGGGGLLDMLAKSSGGQGDMLGSPLATLGMSLLSAPRYDEQGFALSPMRQIGTGLQQFQQEMRQKRQDKMIEQQMGLVGAKTQNELRQASMPFTGTGFENQLANARYNQYVKAGYDQDTALQNAINDTLQTKEQSFQSPTGEVVTMRRNPMAPIGGAQPLSQPVMPQQQGLLAQEPVDYLTQLTEPTGRQIARPIVNDGTESVPQPVAGILQTPAAPVNLTPQLGKMIESVNPEMAATPMGRTEMFKAQIKEAQDMKDQQKGKTILGNLLGELDGTYNQLNQMGGITSTKRGAIENIGASAAASGVGQALGTATGSEASSLRNDVLSLRPLLSQAIMASTGMSAKQLDSNVELQNFLKSATDPALGYETNKKAINRLSKTYGLGVEYGDPYAGFKIVE